MREIPSKDMKLEVRFGEFLLDSRGGLVSLNGYAVKLQPQPLRMLELLVERAPEVVTREELGDHVWGAGVHVELDASLNYCIRQIRLALRDSAGEPRYVETLPKQGYRLLAEVERGGAGCGGCRGGGVTSYCEFGGRRGWWTPKVVGGGGCGVVCGSDRRSRLVVCAQASAGGCGDPLAGGAAAGEPFGRQR